MLREVTPSASDDAARLGAVEIDHSNHHLPDLGAELRDASPEVRAAAVLRSQRLPKPEVMRDAWRSLPGSLQDRIGTAALTHSFYSRESQEDPCGLTLEAGRWAGEIETQALKEVEAVATAALPELYGRDGEEPQWAIGDAPLSFPDRLAFTPTKPPSPLQLAITVHHRSWQTLQASNALFDAIGRPDRKETMWSASDAEAEAGDDVMTRTCARRCSRRA